jgi:hypothetical protein
LLFIYSGLLFMGGSLSLTLNQLINDRFYTDVTWREYLNVPMSLFKRDPTHPATSSTDSGPAEVAISLNSSDQPQHRREELSNSSRELYVQIESRFIFFVFFAVCDVIFGDPIMSSVSNPSFTLYF